MSDSTTLISSITETIEKVEKRTEKNSEVKQKTPRKDKSTATDLEAAKKNIRYLSHDGVWNKAGILSLFNEDEDDMTYCTASGIPLFFIARDGKRWDIESYGYCAGNGKPYARDHLRMSEDSAKSSFPIVYKGAYSLEEYNKPLTDEENAELRRLYKI